MFGLMSRHILTAKTSRCVYDRRTESFDDNSIPHGSWEVVKAVENEQKSGVGNAVIVGIDNGNAWRDSELHRNQSVRFSTLKCSVRTSNQRAKSLTIFL